MLGMELHWEEPPSQRQAPAKYGHIFEAVKERRGDWARVDIPGLKNPSNFAANTRSGRVQGSKPAGSFDAVTRMVDGERRLYIRYVGPQSYLSLPEEDD